MKKIRVMIVDDQLIVREGLKKLLEISDNIEVVAEASSGLDCIELIEKAKPKIILMDIKMPGINGIEATKEILSTDAKVKVLALSINSDRQFVKNMLDAGAVGYLLKDDAPEQLIEAIEKVYNGDMYLSPGVTRAALSKDDPELSGRALDLEDEQESISIRERQILQLISEGLRNKEIAEKFFISPLTVKSHIYHLYKKLDVSSRIKAVEKAKGMNII